jgi:hypothetical protein
MESTLNIRAAMPSDADAISLTIIRALREHVAYIPLLIHGLVHLKDVLVHLLDGLVRRVDGRL